MCSSHMQIPEPFTAPLSIAPALPPANNPQKAGSQKPSRPRERDRAWWRWAWWRWAWWRGAWWRYRIYWRRNRTTYRNSTTILRGKRLRAILEGAWPRTLGNPRLLCAGTWVLPQCPKWMPRLRAPAARIRTSMHYGLHPVEIASRARIIAGQKGLRIMGHGMAGLRDRKRGKVKMHKIICVRQPGKRGSPTP